MRLYNRFDNRLHRVNRVSHSQLLCTATRQVLGALSRALSYVNLDVRGDVFVQFLLTLIELDSLSDLPAVINV